ncbi:hypothetical protein WISP_41176 [Willisornis vidua]|uniref:Uncharacterized protein n=1 Tax=Willisornis vidua TaxID=1566151 RepID=A0ABQ9DLB3_9PASS|nr:hypothetical protein WISP_41176 [Willisornis vidua]
MGETLKDIQQVKTGKAVGVDGIPPKVWKHGGQALYAKFHKLIVRCWEQGKLLRDLSDTVIITLCKKTGLLKLPRVGLHEKMPVSDPYTQQAPVDDLLKNTTEPTDGSCVIFQKG